MSARRVAAVDCGTNTIKLLVADLDPGSGREHEVLRRTRTVRLGEGVDRTGRIGDEALGRVLAAVEEYAALVRELGAEAVRFCATSAARDAENAAVFLDGVQERLGVRPEVLSGSEEARLSYDGATRGLLGRGGAPGDGGAVATVPTPVLVVDIGGGSTELVLGEEHGAVRAGHSLDVGSVRLTERLLHGDPPTAEERARAGAVVDAALDELPAHGVGLGAARTLVVVSGTGLTLAAAALGLRTLDRDAVDGAVVPVEAVRSSIEAILGLTVAERDALGYVLPGRADVIGGGAVVLERVLARVPVTHLRASVADILDGIAWSLVALDHHGGDA